MDGIRRHLHELEQASGGFADGFQAFLGKLAGLAGSLALILHMIGETDTASWRSAGIDLNRAGSQRVSRKVVEDAGRLVRDFILPHAFEFYRAAETVTD